MPEREPIKRAYSSMLARRFADRWTCSLRGALPGSGVREGLADARVGVLKGVEDDVLEFGAEVFAEGGAVDGVDDDGEDATENVDRGQLCVRVIT
jgi:hypothetical protein